MNRVFSWPVGQDRRGFNLPLRYSIEYAAAAAIGGLVLGSLLAALSALADLLPRSSIVYPAAVLAFIALLFQLAGHMGFLPERKAQVPRAWLSRSPAVFAAGFGLMLGFGVLTYLRNAVAYGILAGVVASGDAVVAVSAGMVFGAIRGLGPLFHRLFRTPEHAAFLERVVNSTRLALLVRLALAGVGLVIVVQIAGLTA